MGQPPDQEALRLSVVVPFHRNLAHLERCLRAVRTAGQQLPPGQSLVEIIVVADGARDDPAAVARAAGARVLAIPGPSGPAVARTRGAASASGNLLVFVDSDVAVHPDALVRLAGTFDADPGLGAAFGAYDDEPADKGFFSQCRNLAHAFIHRRSRREARTFWAGLGGVRADVFAAVRGFDERFTRPSVEDIDLGYRLTGAGFRIALEPRISGQHLKRWTFASSVVSDVRDRGVPWTQLIRRYGAMANDLNISVRYRLCVVLAYLLAGSLAGGVVAPAAALAAPVLAAGLWRLDHEYYRFFIDRRGWLFTLRWFPFHVLHHLCNGLSFVAGNLLFLARRTGLALPWSLPVTAWPGTTAPGTRVHAHP
ncbi:MAG TPA: glycosyltransferase [Vicinamibacterales bacterium]|nr:glycosyltransferase [Vicinamibacterales bacterium]